jgi:hypothetical protein
MSDETRPVLLRGWPGLGDWRRPSEPTRCEETPRLWQRPGVVLYAAALRDAMPETFGLGAALVISGPSVSTGCLIVADEEDPEVRRCVERWATAHPLTTTVGPRPWHVGTLSEFFDPFATVEQEPAKPWAFTPTAYSGAGFVVGADLGRTFGLMAEHCLVRRRENRDGWTIWLPGWSRDHANGPKPRSPHRPPLRLSARRVGWQVGFAPCRREFGKYTPRGPWRGAFVDVLSLAYALDADRGASFGEHREDFGLAAVELPLAVDLDKSGAAEVASAVVAIHELAVAVDEEAGRWCTTSEERREGRGHLDLVRRQSPGTLAAEIPTRFRLRAPLDVHDMSETEHRRWAQTFHGGWCEVHPRVVGRPFPAVSADLSSCYPLVAHHVGWWDVMSATGLRPHVVTADLCALLLDAMADPTVALDPAVWQRFGATLVEVVPDGERLCVAVDDPRRPDGRTEVVPVYARDRHMFYTWPDVMAAAVLSRRVPRVVKAVHFAPEGRQEKMRRRLPFLPGLVLDADEDPAVALVRRRRVEKERADAADDELAERAHQRSAAELRVADNSLCFGNASRMDETWRRKGRSWERHEQPGPWTCFPVASTVTAGARLLLAVAERMVTDRGGLVAYRDTDSTVIPSTPDGGMLDLADESRLRALSWAEVDEVCAAFEPLSPEPGAWPVWKIDREKDGAPLRVVIFGAKRHAAFTEREAGDPDLVDATELGLGGTYVDPAGMRGRVAPIDGYRQWSMAAVRREVDFARARAEDPYALRSAAPWDAPDRLPHPALRRFEVKTPAMAASLPACLGARPGTRYIEAERSWPPGAPLVALDPGGDLGDWQELGWVDKATGEPVVISTDPMDVDAAQVVTLDEKARDWSRPSKVEQVAEVVVTTTNVRAVGRASGVLDAAEDGEPGAPRDHRPAYGDELRPCACGCGEQVPATGRSSYVGTTHRERAKKRRQRSRRR